jgi:glycerate-2-kinase
MSLYSNFTALATTPLRKDALMIAEAAYDAIDTTSVISNTCKLEGDILHLKGTSYDLRTFEYIYVIGFGKASCTASAALEKVLEGRISSGIIIDKHIEVCRTLEAYQGEHPTPSARNVDLSEKIVALSQKATEKDLVIVIVSGGGSSLLCHPMSEYEQGVALYEKFLATGGTITELNTLRKHISGVKGGGLAKVLYPATVAALIFSDVPGNAYEQVASGPTYKDSSTIADAVGLLEKYGIENTFTFNETPKEDIYFEKVTNIPLVSNVLAVEGMKDKAASLGYKVVIQNTGEYREASLVLQEMKASLEPKTVVLVAGEPSVVVVGHEDVGGRSAYAAVKALNFVEHDQLCLPFATDGIDNKSEAAGALIDGEVVALARTRGSELQELLSHGRYDDICKMLGTQVITGPTGSNVSDCIIFMQA